MKKLLSISAFLLFIGFTSTANAQNKVDKVGDKIETGAKKTGHALKKGAKKVGHETAEAVSNSKAKITDETYKDKVGPNGQTVYIDNHSRYYWIDDKGHRHYVTEAQLKDKNKE